MTLEELKFIKETLEELVPPIVFNSVSFSEQNKKKSLQLLKTEIKKMKENNQ